MFRIIILGIFFSALARAEGVININIDAPEFRPMAVAVPDFTVEGGDSNIARSAAAELRRILEFCGLFRVLNTAAFNHISTADIAKDGETKLNPSAWKQVGVETLITGVLKADPTGPILELRAFDITKGKEIAGKRYTNAVNYTLSVRKFGDRILKALTGKPGIFTTKIVFVGRKKKGDSKQIYISDFDGGNVEQITTKSTPHLSPSWGPDGKSIVYTSFETGDPNVFLYDLASRQSRMIAGEQGLDSGAQFEPNGKYMAYSHAIKGETDLFLKSINAGKSLDFVRGTGLDVDAVFSPDGKYLAWVSGRFGTPHIFRGDLKWSGGVPSVVRDERLTFAGWYNATPAWSHDSEKIAFASYDKEINRFDLFMMNPDGRKMERLTLRSGDNESPSFSPNSQLIMFHSSRQGTADIKGPASIYVMYRDGSNQRRLSIPLYEAQTPKWGPFIEFD
jgi:TolB protein